MSLQSVNHYSSSNEAEVDYLVPQPRNLPDESNHYETYDFRGSQVEPPKGAAIFKQKTRKNQKNCKKIFHIGLSFVLIIISLGIGVLALVKGVMDKKQQHKVTLEKYDLLQQRLENMTLLEQHKRDLLQQKLENLTLLEHKRALALRAGYERLDDGWIGLFNGYQYKRIPHNLNYTRSMEACSNVDATLAIYGVRDMSTRRTLSRAFPFGYMWIGLQRKDGTWRWQNGHDASNATVLWHPGRPNAFGDCVCIHFTPSSLLSYDVSCANYYLWALCEKAWEG